MYIGIPPNGQRPAVGVSIATRVEIEKATWRRVRDVEDGEPRSHGGTRLGDGGKRILYMDGDG